MSSRPWLQRIVRRPRPKRCSLTRSSSPERHDGGRNSRNNYWRGSPGWSRRAGWRRRIVLGNEQTGRKTSVLEQQLVLLRQRTPRVVDHSLEAIFARADVEVGEGSLSERDREEPPRGGLCMAVLRRSGRSEGRPLRAPGGRQRPRSGPFPLARCASKGVHDTGGKGRLRVRTCT